MDQTDNSHPPVTEEFEAPKTQLFSAVINGIFNGGTLAAAPIIGLQLLGKSIANKWVAFATVTGCSLGGAYGLYEAHDLDAYRTAMNSKIQSLDRQMRHNTAALNQWAEREKARETKQHGAAEKTV